MPGPRSYGAEAEQVRGSAPRIGVTRQTVIAIEQGRYSPTLEAAFRIAEAFGTPLDAVFQHGAAARKQWNHAPYNHATTRYKMETNGDKSARRPGNLSPPLKSGG